MALIDIITNHIQKYGWLAVANVFFDNSISFNPWNISGRCTYCPSEEMFFFIGSLDGSNTDAYEKKFLVQDNKYVDMQQTIVAMGTDMLQKAEFILATQGRHYKTEDETFWVPDKFPNQDAIEGMTLDPETGLSDSLDTITLMSGEKIAAYDLFPEDFKDDIERYVGLRVKAAQEYYRIHDIYVAGVEKYFGVSGCI